MMGVPMYQWCAFCCLLCFLLPTATSGSQGIDPKIVTTKGNLIIQSGINKNISFDVGENNDILFGGTSLKALAKEVKKQGERIGSATCQNGGVLNTADGVSYCICKGNWFGVECSKKTPTECKYELSSAVGQISSPGFPFAYPPNTECTWTIKAPQLQSIEIFIIGVGIAVGSSKECKETDYLKITDNFQLDQKICSVLSYPMELVASNELTVTFKSGPERPIGPGFSILYSKQKNGICGGHMTGLTGILESPKHEKPVVCDWLIDNGATELLQLQFDVINLVNDAGSCKNYLGIYEGSNSDAPLARKICESVGKLTINLQSSTAYVKFVSSDATSSFHGIYDIICGGTHFMKSGSYELMSPGYPKLYPNKKTCTWNFKTATESTLAVRFIEFDVEPHPSCSYDMVAIYDGKTTSSKMLANYCGNKSPLPVMSYDQNLMVVFQSDGDRDFRGFKATVDVVTPDCGGIFTGQKGLIHTPTLSHSGDCIYTISSDKPGHGIELYFSKFSLHTSTNCDDEYIQIFEGQVVTGNPQKFCGSNVPAIQTTEKMSLTVKFFSKSLAASTEFFGEWKSILKPSGCNFGLTHTAGDIRSVNYPNNYDPNLDCTYVITTEIGHSIKLVFDVFALEHHTTCVNDYLAIYDGPNADAPLLGTFCGTRSPQTIVSSSNTLFIHFKTDLSGEDKGFHAEYITGTGLCGGFLHQNTGYINSPNYPNPYPPNHECVWYIQSDEGNTIDLSIVDFALKECDKDYIRIYDGANREKQIAELCGVQASKTTFSSSSRHLMIEFKSNEDTGRKGFQFYFKSGCGEKLYARSGVIKSPGYPNNYPLSRNCEWSIHGHPNDIIKIESSVFNLQPSPTCEFDYLQVTADNKELKRYCGLQGPSQNYTSPDVYLKFISDNRISNKGFEVTYNIYGCSGDLTNPTGSFSSPEYPNDFPAKSYCKWRIIVEEGKRVQLLIPKLLLGNCKDNKMTVYNGDNEDSPILQSYCDHPHRIVLFSSSNKLTVLFTSGFAGAGFSAQYVSVEGGCGGDIESTSGFIHSPFFPSNYGSNAACTWKIKSPLSGNLKLTFKSFDLEKSDNCSSNDYLKVVDSKTSNMLGQFCGSSVPAPQVTTSSEMDVTFVSNGNNGNKGFEAYYEPGCGGTIYIDNSSSSGFISTPNFPGNYSENVCAWLLKTAANRVYLRFDSFSLENAVNGVCSGDYVQIHDGDGPESPLLKTACGQDKPNYIVTTGNSMYIKFVANKVNHFTGFKAEYSSVHTGCGGELTHYKGSIANVEFPERTSTFRYCEYDIKIAAGSRIVLTFEVFDLAGDPDCTDTFIRIMDNGVQELKACSNEIPVDFKSKTNNIQVMFASASDGGGSFKINYKTDCNMNLVDTSGLIQSPNYPHAYPHNSECFWSITAAPHINIILEFHVFNLQEEEHGICNDAVQIFDEYYTLLATYCGKTLPVAMESKDQSYKIKFVSDSTINAGGFSIKYAQTIDPSAACGGLYETTGVPGYISTPHHPLNYPPDQHCEYQIDSLPGTTVKLTFLVFSLEGYYCYYDHVNIYDGNKDNLMETLCSSMGENNTYHSTGSRMIVTFYSDENGVYPGFKAKYEKACGGVKTATKGKISSPIQDGKYVAMENCTWVVSQSPGSVIKLYFTLFDLEDSTNCTKDYVILRNGLTADSTLIGRYCGKTLPSNYTSTGSDLFVQFVSDNATAAGGFEIIYERFIHGCGGTEFLTDHTLTYELVSPGYPDSYPDNIECEWVLKVPDGHVVDFSIVDFTSNFSCTTDFLELYAGPTTGYPLIGSFCGTNLPHEKHYKSQVNSMYVRLLTGKKPNEKKAFFKATWKIGCGGYYVAKAGVISSPSYPSQYPPNSNCSYHIQVLEKKQVHLVFNSFSLHKNGTGSACLDNGDYIEISSGDNIKKEVGRYCGSNLPNPVVSLTDTLRLRFISNGAFSDNGFEARFDTVGQVCGGSLYFKGAFQTPFHPLQYPLHRECVWVLESTPGIAVQLKFLQFDLESTPNCTGDRVVIRNGRHFSPSQANGELSPVIGTYCGSTPPPIIHSSGNHLTVIFISDSSPERGTGFKANFTSSDIGCGGEVSGKKGSITSPGYPTSYTVDVECEWKISVPQGNIVKITLEDINLEPQYLGMCFDYVELTEAGSVIEKLCGERKHNGYTYTSFATTISVKFYSDESDTFPGFKLNWEAVTPSCNDVIVPAKSGEILNPGYPGYKSNLDCSWIWRETEGETITLQLFDVDVYSSANCSVDSIIIQNGEHPDSPVLATLCGNMNKSENKIFVSSEHHMRLTFKTGEVANRNARGFKIGFTTRDAGCGGVFFDKSGTIISPNYPEEYPTNAFCTWVIQTEVGSKIYLYVDDLDIEDHSKCEYDSLEVRDGDSVRSPFISRLCGTVHDSVYQSSSNYMFIVFKSDVYGGGRGFKLQYNVGCGGILKGRSGYALSPNYPNQYPPNQDCRWKINVTRDYHVKLTELDFNLPPYNELYQCVGDYVQIRNGLNISAPVLSTFCGDLENQQYESPYHQLFIQFVSDNVTDGVYNGSKAHYTAVCGETIVTDKPGILKYPAKGSTYIKNETCVWVIEFPEGENIVIDTKKFVVESYQDFHCFYDYLEIRDGKDESAPLFGRFCGTHKPPMFKSNTNYVYFKFVADESLQKEGFEIHYTKAMPDDTCGGTFTAASGNITSPGFPRSFPTNLNCGWRIQQPEGYRINLTFTQFRLTKPSLYYDSPRDCKNFIRIYEAAYPDETYRSLNVTCGDLTGFEMQSLSNELYISFHSYNKPAPETDGFQISYVSHTSGCGGLIKLEPGETTVFTSPGYPGNITEGPNCHWILKGPVGYSISATFDEISFHTLPDGSCPDTYLIVYDGLRAKPLALCGMQIQGKTLRSSLEVTQLTLIRKGALGNPFKGSVTLVKGCNQTFTKSSGLVTSPNYPFNYLHKAECHYFITAPAGQTITLFPITMNIEYHADCIYDDLEINDGADSSASQLGKKYCGTELPPTLSSSGNQMHLLLKTDEGVTKNGFAFSYTMSSGECGGNITGFVGSITTPKYPQLYDGQYECEWDITVPVGRRLNLTIVHFELEPPAPEASCTTVDFLEVIDNGSSLGKFCGAMHVSRMTMSGNTAKIIFKSNNVNNNYRGFQMFYYEST